MPLIMRVPGGPVTGRRENQGAFVQRESTFGSSTVLLLVARNPDMTANFSGQAISTPNKPCFKAAESKIQNNVGQAQFNVLSCKLTL